MTPYQKTKSQKLAFILRIASKAFRHRIRRNVEFYLPAGQATIDVVVSFVRYITFAYKTN